MNILRFILQLLIASNATGQLKKTHINSFASRTLRGYDCDDPRHLHDVASARQETCHHQTHVSSQRNATVQILQDSFTSRIKGHLCKMVVTRTPNYCGNYDHQTMYPRFKLTEVPKTISPDICRRMIRENKYETPAGEDIDIADNEVTAYFYENPGRTYLNPSGEVKCHGENWKIGNVNVPDMVVAHEMKITLQTETFIIRSKEVRAMSTGYTLPCPSHEGSCQTPTATFIWDISDRTCPMAFTRTSHGIIVTDDNGNEVFMSTDNSLVRFVLRDTVSACGEIIQKTNYEHLFLYHGQSAKFQKHQVDPSDVNMITYVNNRDDYLYNRIIDQVEAEMNKVLHHDCEKRASLHQAQAKTSRTELMTISLGNGTFSTQAGETLWTYTCHPVEVTARESETCYLSLPINYDGLESADHPPGTEFFLEPFTRRISTEGVPIRCSDQLHIKYATQSGHWIMVTPKILDAKAPYHPGESDTMITKFDREIDWSEGGVYTTEELKSLRRYMEYSRYKDVLSFKLAQQYQGSAEDDMINPGDLFPETPGFQALTKGLFSYIMDFIHSFGDWAAIFLGSYLIVNFTGRLFHYVYRLLVLKEAHGFSLQLFFCCCPELLMLRKYKEDYRQCRTNTEEPEENPPILKTPILNHQPTESANVSRDTSTAPPYTAMSYKSLSANLHLSPEQTPSVKNKEKP